jgi:hypothetical protein
MERCFCLTVMPSSPHRMQEAHNYRKQDQLFHMVMHLPCALAAVSEAVQVPT